MDALLSVVGRAVLESGDEPAACTSRRTLVLANHQSTADVPMLMAAWNPRPGLLSNLMWIMDRVFKFTNFGIVSVLHKDFFIQAVSSLYFYFTVDGPVHSCGERSYGMALPEVWSGRQYAILELNKQLRSVRAARLPNAFVRYTIHLNAPGVEQRQFLYGRSSPLPLTPSLSRRQTIK
ncbi:unnamed protein product, partial [Iphiclides podalirius]